MTENREPSLVDEIFEQARSAEPYFDDKGFTGAVLAQLPAYPAPLATWKKLALLLLCTSIGCALALFTLPVADLPLQVIVSGFLAQLVHPQNLVLAGLAVGSFSLAALWAGELAL